MPKSRGRKSGKACQSWVVSMTPQVRNALLLLRQREAFKAKFGRDPGPNDLVFFDLDAPEPIPMSAVEADVLEAMRKAGTPPQIIYAYKKTGGLLLLEGMREHWPPSRVKEWDDAIDQFFAIEDASKQPDRPSKEEWNTTIPELLVSPFTRKDLAHVDECLRAIAPIEERGMPLITRIELAAALLASACSHGYNSGHEIGEGSYAPKMFALVEQLVVRRAREIYAQDSP
jgi:hypothetical protein